MRQQRQRVPHILPAQRQLRERQQVRRIVTAQLRQERIEIGECRFVSERLIPKRHVEGGMLAAHEPCGADTKAVRQHQRQQRERLAFGIARDHDERRGVIAAADLPLPGCEKIEALIGRSELPSVIQCAPGRLRLVEIANDIDARDAACCRPCRRLRRPGSERGSHGHLQKPVLEKIFTQSDVNRPLQRSVNKG